MSSHIKNQIQLYHRLTEHRDGFILEYSELQTLTFDTSYLPPLDEQPIKSSFFSFELIFVFFLLLTLPIFVFIAYHYGKKMGKKENNPPEMENSNSCLMLQHGASSKSTKATLSDSSDGDKDIFTQLDRPLVDAQSHNNDYNKNIFQEEIVDQKQESSPMEVIKSESNPRSLERLNETEDKNKDGFCESNSCSEEGNANLTLLSPQKEPDTDLKVEFLIQRSSEVEESNDAGDDIYIENLKLHTDKDQIKKQEVKFGLTVENRNGVLQKIETKEIKTTYVEGADEPEMNAMLVKKAYDTYKQNPIARNLFIPLSQDKEEQGQSRALVPFNTPQVITGNLDLTRHFTFPGKTPDIVKPYQINEAAIDVISPSQSDLRISKLLEREDFPHETGKFRKIFKNVERIGEGSFGEVYRVILFYNLKISFYL